MTTFASDHLALRHIPRGSEHPYDSSPVERFPRDPIAGQPVIIGAETSPAGSAREVNLIWRVNNGPEQKAPATHRQDTERASQWRATLSPLTEGDHVTYHLTATPNEVTSSSFDFTAAGWHRVGRIVAWHTGPRSLVIEIEDGLSAVISFDQADQAKFCYTFTPAAPVAAGQPENFTLQETDERLIVKTATLCCIIHRDPYRLEILSAAGETLYAEPAGGGIRWLTDGERILRFAEDWVTSAEETFYGFGQRYNAFDQHGQAFDSLVFDEYKNQGKRTYIPIPFFLSSCGYGIYLPTSHRVHFDLAASTPDCASFAVEGSPALEFYFFAGQPKNILSTFTALVGKPALPPKWAFGPWMSGNEWNSQPKVLEQVELSEHHGIPATVLVIEAWSDEATFYIFNDAKYTPRPGKENFSLADFEFPTDGRWPDPKGLIDDLHRRGIKVILWQIPVLKPLDMPHPQHDQDVRYATEQGLVVQEADGRPYCIRPTWFQGGLIPDFTNPAAQNWWLSKRAYLVDTLGVDGFKTDGGEHLWGDDLRFNDGRNGSEVNNLFPNLYQGAYTALAGSNRLVFSRAGYTGTQTVSCHWAGDENSTFEAFRHSITAGLTAGVSGLAFWGWDIAGFSGEIPSAELYLRATAMAAFCPIMQYHSEFNEHRQPCRDRTPWNIQERTGDSDVIPIFRFYTNLRMNLLPYIWSEAIKASLSGLPLMRALPLEFPDDHQVYHFPFQYLFGESLLIAPVAWQGCESLDVYLPEGDWYDLWSGERHSGPKKLRRLTPKNVIPVFVRGGSVLPLNLSESLELGSSVGNAVDKYQRLCFRVYPSRRPTRFEWFEDPHRAPYTFEVPSYE